MGEGEREGGGEGGCDRQRERELQLRADYLMCCCIFDAVSQNAKQDAASGKGGGRDSRVKGQFV